MDMRIKEEQQYTKVASLQLSLVSLSKLVNFPGAGYLSPVLSDFCIIMRPIQNRDLNTLYSGTLSKFDIVFLHLYVKFDNLKHNTYYDGMVVIVPSMVYTEWWSDNSCYLRIRYY